MPERDDRIDWSEDRWKELLVGPRKDLWLDDTVEKLAAWLGLEPGMTAIDVGYGPEAGRRRVYAFRRRRLL